MKADDYIKNVAYKDFNNRNLLDNLDAINQHLILDLMNKFAEAQNKELLKGFVDWFNKTDNTQAILNERIDEYCKLLEK